MLAYRYASAVLGLALAIALQGCAASPETIQLRIENGGPEAIRCTAILAHFVTRSLPIIEQGAAQSVPLARDRQNGTLSFGSHGAEPMMLENILCGRDSDWTASARDLPLQDLRVEPAERFEYRCSLDSERVICTPP